ncbi:MAG: WG repeat-containing protein [Lachnospiraceae bacterium]|nr:WG repeat-containing protein [Lachnospiraceae bacterium]
MCVQNDGKCFYINLNGEKITDAVFQEVKCFRESQGPVKINGKWGFINRSGQTIIPLIYDDAGSFSEGKAAVKQNKYLEGYMDAWAYINPKGEVVIDFYPYMAVEGRMPWVGEFHNGMAFVSDDFYSVIDEEGNWLFNGHESEFFLSSLVYDDEHDAIPAYIYTDSSMKDKKYGLVGIDGKQRLEPVFDYVDGICGDYVWISNVINNQWKYGIIKLTMKQYN